MLEITKIKGADLKMRELNIGSKRFTKVVAVDEKGAGNANHKYYVMPTESEFVGLGMTTYYEVEFQNGAIKENGINGIHNEDLIAIVIDRLQGFQDGDFACRENALALTKLEEALLWLNKRTNDRINRGVEGISVR
jgi:hypothetical protein